MQIRHFQSSSYAGASEKRLRPAFIKSVHQTKPASQFWRQYITEAPPSHSWIHWQMSQCTAEATDCIERRWKQSKAQDKNPCIAAKQWTNENPNMNYSVYSLKKICFKNSSAHQHTFKIYHKGTNFIWRSTASQIKGKLKNKIVFLTLHLNTYVEK